MVGCKRVCYVHDRRDVLHEERTRDEKNKQHDKTRPTEATAISSESKFVEFVLSFSFSFNLGGCQKHTNT